MNISIHINIKDSYFDKFLCYGLDVIRFCLAYINLHKGTVVMIVNTIHFEIQIITLKVKIQIWGSVTKHTNLYLNYRERVSLIIIHFNLFHKNIPNIML